MAQAKNTKSKPKSKAKAAGAAAAAGASADAAADITTPDAAGETQTCREPKCKQPVRAKGYCRKHFVGWRRGAIGKKHRYKVCSKEGCRKPRALGGLCQEHAGIAEGKAETATA
jgi:hypothetical protein